VCHGDRKTGEAYTGFTNARFCSRRKGGALLGRIGTFQTYLCVLGEPVVRSFLRPGWNEQSWPKYWTNALVDTRFSCDKSRLRYEPEVIVGLIAIPKHKCKGTAPKFRLAEVLGQVPVPIDESAK
jgi:hypothetical protein